MSEATRSLAMQVILEIVKQSAGDEIVGKTKLFKAFYFAHLYYTLSEKSYLTDWPIVKMGHGPGIDDFELLVGALKQAGVLETEPAMVGPYRSTTYRATGKPLGGEPLTKESVKAVRLAVEFVAGKTGAYLSDLTHEFSRSWNATELGQEQNIYLDILSDENFDATQDQMLRLKSELEDAWK